MASWLHALDDLRAQAQHDDPNVRRWAIDTWFRLYPDGDLVGLARHLLDDDPEIRADVAEHLAGTGEERWAPVLLRALELAEGADKRVFVRALGHLGHARAVAPLGALVRQARDGQDLLVLIEALGQLRVEGSWRALAPLLDLLHVDDVFGANLVRHVLGLGRRSDVALSVARWRGWERDTQSPTASAFTLWLGVRPDVVRVAASLQELGLAETMARLERLPGGRPLPDGVVDVLSRARVDGADALLKALYGAFGGLVQQRRDRLDLWVHEVLGRPDEDYRALIAGADALLGALAAVAPQPEHEAAELGLALAAWWTVWLREDAHRVVATAADPWAEATRLFAAPDAVVSEVLAQTLRAHPARSVPWLVGLLDDEVADTVQLRALAVLLEIGRADPSQLAAAVAQVAWVLVRRPDTPLAEAATQVLVAAGPVSVEAVAEHLEPDASDEVFHTLGKLPCEASWEALSGYWRQAVRLDLRVAEALTDLGDARAVDLLAPAWSPGIVPLAAMLRALCSLHHIAHPMAARWAEELDYVEGAAAVASATTVAES